MPDFLFLSKTLSIIAFLFYGISCVYSPKLIVEFERYGIPQYRVLTGRLEILGSLGLLAGFVFPPVTSMASLGLALMMLCGIAVRVRIKDSIWQILPAAVLGLLNGFIFYSTI